MEKIQCILHKLLFQLSLPSWRLKIRKCIENLLGLITWLIVGHFLFFSWIQIRMSKQILSKFLFLFNYMFFFFSFAMEILVTGHLRSLIYRNRILLLRFLAPLFRHLYEKKGFMVLAIYMKGKKKKRREFLEVLESKNVGLALFVAYNSKCLVKKLRIMLPIFTRSHIILFFS